MDKRRSDNVEICIRRLKLDFASIRNMILKMDTEGYPDDSLEILAKIAPDHSELAKVRQLKGDPMKVSLARSLHAHICWRAEWTIPVLQVLYQSSQQRIGT